MSAPKDIRQRYTVEVHLEWYDGPLRSIRRVDFVGEPKSESLVEVRTCMAWHDGKCELTESDPRLDYFMRLSREDLVQMLNLLDGKEVEDFNDGLIIPRLEEEETLWTPCSSCSRIVEGFRSPALCSDCDNL